VNSKRLNHIEAAIDNFRKAFELPGLTAEQLFTSKRFRDSKERIQRIAPEGSKKLQELHD
jgi:hypothetical protein